MEVEQDEIDLVAIQDVQGFAGVAGRQYQVALPFQHLCQKGANLLVVI